MGEALGGDSVKVSARALREQVQKAVDLLDRPVSELAISVRTKNAFRVFFAQAPDGPEDDARARLGRDYVPFLRDNPKTLDDVFRRFSSSTSSPSPRRTRPKTTWSEDHRHVKDPRTLTAGVVLAGAAAVFAALGWSAFRLATLPAVGASLEASGLPRELDLEKVEVDVDEAHGAAWLVGAEVVCARSTSRARAPSDARRSRRRRVLRASSPPAPTCSSSRLPPAGRPARSPSIGWCSMRRRASAPAATPVPTSRARGRPAPRWRTSAGIPTRAPRALRSPGTKRASATGSSASRFAPRASASRRSAASAIARS